MTGCQHQSSRLLRLFPSAFLAAVTSLAPHAAVAELILDDFNDQAEVTEVSTGPGTGYKPVVTPNVGDLAATRELYSFGVQTLPNAALDAGVDVPSVLSADFNGHRPQPNANSPIVSFTALYFFSPLDLTEGGINNALLFDFQSHEGSQLPSFFRVFARGPTGIESYEANSQDFQFSGTPFTAVIPFSEFGFRGGGAATPNFSRLESFKVDFYFIRPSADIEWSVQLDRVRIGSIPVPEPTSVCTWVIGVSLLAGGQVGRWRRPHSTGGESNTKNNHVRRRCTDSDIPSSARGFQH